MKHAHLSHAGRAGPRHELLRMLAHDVRSPLNTISMASDLLESRIERTADLQRPIEIIRAAVRQIDRIVEDVLVSGAAQASATSLRHVTEAGALITELVDQHRDLAELRGVQLQGEPPPMPLFAAAAREALLHALTNLLTNAIRHTPPECMVRLAAQQLGADIAFRVTDTGAGMDQAEVERLLLRAIHERSTGATGHGLRIVHDIVRRAGGHLSAVSRPGVGSTFTICIPAAFPADASPSRPRPISRSDPFPTHTAGSAMSRIVIAPLDGSAFAEQALPLALAVARTTGARLQLVRVQPSFPLDLAGTETERYLMHMAAELQSQLPGRIDYQVLVDEFGPLEYEPPASNTVANAIQRHAADVKPVLMVLATHGYGGVRRAWLGSVADSLIRIASCPVLLVRPQDEAFGIAAAADRGIGHVLVPLDGSEVADRVIPFALELGMPFGARYTLLRVVSPLTFAAPPRSYDPYPAPNSPLSRDAVRLQFDGAADRIRRTGASCAIDIVDGGSAAGAILDYAHGHGVDAIVMATEGAGRVRRVLLGSVTDRIVRGSDLPVLVCNVRSIPTDAMLAAPESAHTVR